MSKTNPFPRMHVSLYVSNLQKSINFYSALFGQEPTKVKQGYAKYTLESPSLIISFVENKDRVQQNFGHLGFQVETIEELNRRLAEAKLKNLVSKEEIGTNCCYAKQDKFWANDPDGVQWEVYYFHEDAEFNDPHYEMSEATACCIVSSETTKSDCGCNANVVSTETASTTKKTVCC
jgi:catechol 2,3-dioxygenase-like lactoylglutathione lyase family enzyme